MNTRRFDDLSRSVSNGSSRRTLLAGLAAMPALGIDRAAAKKGKKKQKTFRFAANPMTGAQEVAPTIGDPIGSGSSSFTIKGNKICGTFNLSTATSFTVTGTHIHEGSSTVNGPIVVDFGVATLGVQVCLDCATSACASGVLGRIKANPAGFYANIHTSTNTAGAVRAQLQRV